MNTTINPDESRQSLRLRRHLIGMLTNLVYTLFVIYLQYRGYFATSDAATWVAILIYWLGVFTFTIAFFTGFNKRFSDPSLTMIQMVWASMFTVFIIYALKDMREIVLMTYLALLSFGNFRLNLEQFIINVGLTVIGYMLVIAYLYANEPLRLNIEQDIIMFLCFLFASAIIVYTGSSINKLRELTREKTNELTRALELNTRLATMDDLTGLYTRRYLMGILDKQKALSEREGGDFVICFADLDHFKYVNDSFGHHTGDKVLKIFSDIIRSSIREIDYASRFGGEEFVILLVNTELEQAKNVAERIRESIEKFNFSDVAPALNVTVSIGISNYRHYNSIQETLMSADNKMYRAKELGRNKVVVDI